MGNKDQRETVAKEEQRYERTSTLCCKCKAERRCSLLVSFMYQSTTHCDITQPYLDVVVGMLRKVDGVSGTKSPC